MSPDSTDRLSLVGRTATPPVLFAALPPSEPEVASRDPKWAAPPVGHTPGPTPGPTPPSDQDCRRLLEKSLEGTQEPCTHGPIYDSMVATHGDPHPGLNHHLATLSDRPFFHAPDG